MISTDSRGEENMGDNGVRIPSPAGRQETGSRKVVESIEGMIRERLWGDGSCKSNNAQVEAKATNFMYTVGGVRRPSRRNPLSS